jgi:hypothetical protein
MEGLAEIGDVDLYKHEVNTLYPFAPAGLAAPRDVMRISEPAATTRSASLRIITWRRAPPLLLVDASSSRADCVGDGENIGWAARRVPQSSADMSARRKRVRHVMWL